MRGIEGLVAGEWPADPGFDIRILVSSSISSIEKNKVLAYMGTPAPSASTTPPHPQCVRNHPVAYLFHPNPIQCCSIPIHLPLKVDVCGLTYRMREHIMLRDPLTQIPQAGCSDFCDECFWEVGGGSWVGEDLWIGFGKLRFLGG